MSADDLARRYDALLRELPLREPIYLPTDELTLPEKVIGLEKVRDLYRYRLDEHRDALRLLKQRFEGCPRAFIIGNGPSLNETDLSRLASEVTFCVNGFFLKMPELEWTPTFYVVEDHLVAEDRAAEIADLRGPTKLFPASLRYCVEEGPDTVFFDHRPRPSYPDGFDFSSAADEATYTGCTVTFTCMQLAHWLGFQEIYLVGVDASYAIPDDAKDDQAYGTGVLDMASDDPNHFHPDYFGKGYRWHDPQVDKMLGAYREAKRAADASGRPIYNATVGGRLELFERRDFDEVTATPPGPRAPMPTPPLPKVLVVDAFGFGGGTATGELKSALFAGWPKDRLVSMSASGHDAVRLDGPERGVFAPKDASARAARFAPDVVLYRPVPGKPTFTKAAEAVLARTDAPLVTWVMDLWQDRLAAEDPKAGAKADRRLAGLFADAARRLVIGEAMASAFAERYDHGFTPLANGIDPPDWPDRTVRPRGGRPFRVRYAGGLAPDMTLGTLMAVAAAIEAAEEAIVLEIQTRDYWVEREGSAFAGFSRTRMSDEELDGPAYRAWLSEADVVLVAYDFGEAARTYARLSLGNKLPEALASGAAVLGVGPAGFATIEALVAAPGATVVTEPDEIGAALARLANDADLAARGAASRAHAFEAYRLEDRRARLAVILRAAVRSPRRRRRRRVLWDRPMPAPVGRLAGFYRGRRVVLPALAVVLAALPGLPMIASVPGAALGPAAGLALAFVVVGNWLSQLR